MPNPQQELELLKLQEEELMLMQQQQQQAPQPAPSRGDLPQPKPAKEHELTDRDLNMATQGLKVSPKVLADTRRLVPFFGGKIQGEEAPLSQRVLGFLGDSLAFGLPQKAFIESQAAEPRGIAKYYKSFKEMTEPEGATADLTSDEIAYVDRVRQMAVAKKGWGQWLLEAGAGLAVPGGLAAKAGKGASTATKLGWGAVEGGLAGTGAGVGYSARGEEGKGALVGGTLGAGLGAGLTGMFMGANWLWKGGGGETASATAVKKQMERLNVMDEAEKLVLKGEEVDEAVRVAAADIKTKGSTPHKFITDPDKDLPLAALNRVRESSGELGSLRGNDITAKDFRQVLFRTIGRGSDGKMKPSQVRKKWAETTANYHMVRDAFSKKTIMGGDVDYLTRTDLTMLKLFQLKKSIDPNEVTDAMANMWKYEQLFKKMPRETRRGLSQAMRELKPDELVPQKIIAELDDYVNSRLQGAYMKQAAKQELVKAGKELPILGPGNEWFLMFSDGKPIQMLIDNRYGTDFSMLIDELDNKTILMRNLGNDLAEELSEMKAAGQFAEQRSDGPTEEMQNFYEYVRGIFNSKNVGMNIDDYGEDYIPKVFKLPKKMTVDVATRAKEVLEKAGGEKALRKMKPREYQNWVAANDDVEELARSLEILTGQPLAKGGEGLYKAMKDFRFKPTEFRAKMSTLARGEQLRKDAMPNLITEQDPYEATLRYVQNTLRHATFKDYIPRILNIRDVALQAEDKHVAEYMNNLVTDMLHLRTEGNWLYRVGKKTAEAWEKRHLNAATETADPKTAEWHTLMADMPGILQHTNANVYPNFIGMSPKAVYQNSVSPFHMNIGALGPQYGSQVAMEAVLRTMKTIRSKEGMEGMISRLGLVERDFKGEMAAAAEQGLIESKFFKAGSKAVKWWTNVSMYMFSKSEQFARVVNWHMAERVGVDLLRGVKGDKDFNAQKAMQFLEDMSDRAYRERIIKLIRADEINEDQVIRHIQQYMNAQSMFNYSRANMSEFSRTMGPMFSTFTKWPSTMTGKVYQQLHDEGKGPGGARLAKFFLYPFVAAQIADGMLYGIKDEPAYKNIVGSQGLKGGTPVYSLGPYTKGEFLLPPAADAVFGLSKGVGYMLEGEPKKALRTIEKSASGYVPLYNFYPFLNQKVPGFFNMEPLGPKTITDAVLEDN